jgi:glycosyltransferase involved in cell wall biosynthesis
MTRRPGRPERIDQLVHVLAGRDAIGTHVRQLQSLFREAGYASDIYVGEAEPEMRPLSTPVEELVPAGDGTWLLFHHSTGTPVAEAALRHVGPLLVDYHNVTPARLVERWAPWVRSELELGVEQLNELAPRAIRGIAHSAFSAGELRAAGCGDVAVLPLLFETPATAAPGGGAPGVEPPAVGAPVPGMSVPGVSVPGAPVPGMSVPGAMWLFVGRVSPHKAQHDVVKAFACYRRLYDREARLVLVGTFLGADYHRALERFVIRLGLQDAVTLTGPVPAVALAAHYASADVFVCLSDHEGFCIPIVEAMGAGVPVVAYDAAAVGETVGTGGLLLEDKSPLAVATAVDRVVSAPEVRGALVAAGRRRAESFALTRSRATWAAVLAALGGASDRPDHQPSFSPTSTAETSGAGREVS